MFASLAIGFALQGQEVDPYRLNLGSPGAVTVSRGHWTDLRTGSPASAEAFAAAADGYRFVFVGESHTHPQHHQNQAAVIEALVKRGRTVIVGFEMFTRPNQDNLNPWSMGWWTPEEFQARADWKTQWGFDYKLYSPIFEVIKANRLPMVALNVPRDWVRAVGKGGLSALTAEQQGQLPPVYTENKEHKQVFDALMGGHPMTGPSGANIYAGQCLWDEGMADSALKYMTKRFGSVEAAPANAVFVIVAGSGHGMYKQCINWRIKRRTGLDCLTLIQIEDEGTRQVSKGLADFVFVGDPLKE